MKKSSFAAIVIVLSLMTSAAFGQGDLGEQLKKMAATNAKNYVAPIMYGWAAGLNSGLYYTADIHGILGFDVHVKATFAVLQDVDKTYKFQTPPTVGPYTRGTDYPAEVTANTVVGKDEEVIIRHNTLGTELMRTPKGFKIPATPLLPIPQVSIGLPLGFEVMGRFFPTAKISDVGKISIFGYGLRHDIDQYIPLLPLDVAVHFMTQKISYEDSKGSKLLEATGTSFGVEVSKSIILLTLYGGFSVESSNIKVGPYDATISAGGSSTTVRVNQFEFDGKNKSRLVVGARFSLLFLNLHADYSIASTPVIALGVGISIR